MQRATNARLRNLDEIQETDPVQARPSKLGALLVASLGGACVVLASVMLLRKPAHAPSENVDPLGSLVTKARSEAPAETVDVTFPRMLSNSDQPTTALEAIRNNDKVVDPEFNLPLGHPTAPPPAADRLPVMPLPAQQLLSDAGKEPQFQSPSDSLGSATRQVSRETGTEVEAGQAGGFQLQVSSFKTDEEAQSFASALRRRGHHAYVESANVKGRGLWHRVRIGPFKYKRSADTYRQEFEAKERIVTFIVSPQKTKIRVAQAGDAASED
jgi:cell division septation protein DedD